MASLLVIEPCHGGHHATWLRWIIDGAVARGQDVVLGTLEASLSEEPRLAALREALRGRVRFVSTGVTVPEAWRASELGVRRLVRREMLYWEIFRELWSLAGGESLGHVLVPYLDYCAYAVGFRGSPFGRTPWRGLVMRPSFHYREMGVEAPPVALAGIKERLYWRLLRSPTLDRLFSIDPSLVEYSRASGRVGADRLELALEPVELAPRTETSIARRVFGLPDDAFVILVYGELRGRKGVAELVEAVLKADDRRFVVLLAGRRFPEVERVLASPPAARLAAERRLVSIDRVLDEDDEERAFSASDAIWLGYRGHYNMSGVLVQAAAMGRPVIACPEGMIGWSTRREGLGVIAAPSDTDAVARALSDLAADTAQREAIAARARAFAAGRTPDALAESLLPHAARGLALAPLPASAGAATTSS